MSARTRTDWILWGALGCTLIGTAHAEYTLATATGVHWFVAASVPGALDLYVIRALQVHRDVLAAVVAMVVMNVASHLVTAGVLPVHWALISAVGALAPLVLWRIHYLFRTQVQSVKPHPEPSASAPEDALSAPEEPSAGALPPGCVWAHPECAGAPDCTVYSKEGAVPSAPALPPSAPALEEPVRLSADAECVLDSDRRNGGRTSMRALRAEYGWGQERATNARRDVDKAQKGVGP